MHRRVRLGGQIEFVFPQEPSLQPGRSKGRRERDR